MLKWSYDFISSEKVKEYKDGAVEGGGGGGGIERWYQRPQSETGRNGHNGCGGHLQYFAGPSSTLNTIRVSDNTLVDTSLSIQIQCRLWDKLSNMILTLCWKYPRRETSGCSILCILSCAQGCALCSVLDCAVMINIVNKHIPTHACAYHTRCPV